MDSISSNDIVKQGDFCRIDPSGDTGKVMSVQNGWAMVKRNGITIPEVYPVEFLYVVEAPTIR